jgi:hypothetical protein
MNDSITKLDIEILDMESQEISGSELGAIKYVSELLDWDIKRTANLFILILIFVFDPLAITLVIATNQAFKSRRKEEEYAPQVPINHPPSTPQVNDTDELPINYRLTTDKVNEYSFIDHDISKELSDDIENDIPKPSSPDLVVDELFDTIDNYELDINEVKNKKRLVYKKE